ncbi:MAG TPA: Yip1 family protein [Vitreimonas sp.]|uniref:Yip1 family protein n=1 Tax=Vitreimonas sp. TaxID=3069702 RepID=UPI002D27452D|nr:Yip1 family protein [Vitreimonas sp.]HYD86958.1 Yip1 family protein [Vitreimonas sp.]
MTTDPVSTGTPNLIERAKNILLQPKAEWERIAGEPANVSQLYTGYVLPLVLISAICSFIGLTFIGVSAFGVTVRVPMTTGLVSLVLQVAMGLAGVYVLALVANALAPNFGSVKDEGQAHKLAAYGSTAGFLAGVFAIFPPIAMLGILGLYSLALIYLGLPPLMKTPDDKRIGYFITIIVVMIVVWLVIGAVLGAVRASMGGMGGAPIVVG